MPRERQQSRSESHNAGAFDMERGRLSLSPKMMWALVSAAIAIGGMVAGVHYRLGSIEGGIVEMQQVQAEDRVAMQTKDAAYVACLEQERMNKGWRCPMAPPLPEPVKAPRRVAKTKAEKPDSGIFAWFGTTATAKPK